MSRKKAKEYPYPNIAAIIVGYLGVREELRGRRIAKRMIRLILERCYEIGKSCGVSLIVVDVETKNSTALKLYSDADFEVLTIFKSGPYELTRLYLPMAKVTAALKISAKK